MPRAITRVCKIAIAAGLGLKHHAVAVEFELVRIEDVVEEHERNAQTNRNVHHHRHRRDDHAALRSEREELLQRERAGIMGLGALCKATILCVLRRAAEQEWEIIPYLQLANEADPILLRPKPREPALAAARVEADNFPSACHVMQAAPHVPVLRIDFEHIWFLLKLKAADFENLLQIVFAIQLGKIIERAGQQLVLRERIHRNDVPLLQAEAELFCRGNIVEQRARFDVFIQINNHIELEVRERIERFEVELINLVDLALGQNFRRVREPCDMRTGIFFAKPFEQRRSTNHVAGRAELDEQNARANLIVLITIRADLVAQLVGRARNFAAKVAAIVFEIGSLHLAYCMSVDFILSCRQTNRVRYAHPR